MPTPFPFLILVDISYVSPQFVLAWNSLSTLITLKSFLSICIMPTPPLSHSCCPDCLSFVFVFRSCQILLFTILVVLNAYLLWTTSPLVFPESHSAFLVPSCQTLVVSLPRQALHFQLDRSRPAPVATPVILLIFFTLPSSSLINILLKQNTNERYWKGCLGAHKFLPNSRTCYINFRYNNEVFFNLLPLVCLHVVLDSKTVFPLMWISSNTSVWVCHSNERERANTVGSSCSSSYENK